MFKRTVINLSFISLSLSFLFLFANIDNSLATNMICHDDNGEHSTIGSSSSSSSVSIFSNNNNKSQNHNNRTTIVSNSRTIFLINDNDDKIVTAANTNTNNNKKRDVHGLNDGKISQKFHRDYSSSTTLSTSSNTLNINFPNNNVDSKNVSSIQTANNEQPFATFVYTVLINDKVQLPCDIQPPSSDDQIVLVLWYKDDELAPILTLDGRKNQLDPGAVQVSASNLRGRAYFNVHGRPAHLSIDPVAASDEGDYRCRVDFRKARTINTVISLKVIVPPQVPKITDQDGNYLSGLVGPYNEGDELALTCLTKGGKPRPSLIWWRDFAIIDDSFEFDDRDVTTNELVITRLSRHHLLAILMCQAINSNITTTPASNSITLDLNLKPSEVRITQLTPILVAGADALFECNTFGSRPMPIIYWLFDGNRYDTRIHGEQQTGSTITLRLERHHRGMIVECITENLRIPNSAIRDQLTLDVQYPPQMELKLGAPSLSLDSIQEGIDIYFDCHVDSNPAPTTPITWLFNGETLVPEPGVIESNQSLVLQRVPRWRNGTYQCKCSNQQGTMISNEIHLEIKFAPVCKIPYTLIYGLQLNEIIQIGCEVQARPTADVSFQWRFEKHTNLANFIVINETKSILEYVPRTRDQYGLIECTAKNSIGIQREPCQFLIVPSANPYFPYQCLVSNQSDSTLSIRCDGSFLSGNISYSTTESSSISDNNNKHYDATSWLSSQQQQQHGNNISDDELDELNSEIDASYTGSGGDDDDDITSSTTKLKYIHNSYKNQRPEQISDSVASLLSNLTTSDIYAMYFAPDLQPQTAVTGNNMNNNDGTSNMPNTDQDGQSIKVTYRNGVGPFPANGPQRAAAASMLFLNELVTKFNSHPLNLQPHLLVYPPTYYICEIYSLSPKPTLIKNLTIDAIGKRIMNPLLNGSFSFLVDELPSNTPLRVNIYAQNNRKRSIMQVELDAKTLRAAERRIDYEGHQGQHAARGRKSYSTFFEELYGGYGRFRNKHMVVGLMISTVAITVIIAIILITIAILRSRHHQQQQNPSLFNHRQGQNENSTTNHSKGRTQQTMVNENEQICHNTNELIMLGDKLIHIQKQKQLQQMPATNNNDSLTVGNKNSGSLKRKNQQQQQQQRLSRSNQSLNNNHVLETTFLTSETNFDDDDDGHHHHHHHHHDVVMDGNHIRNNQMDLVEFANANSVGGGANGYGMDLIGADDDSSMRSDHQLIQSTNDSDKYYKSILTTKRTATATQNAAPPNYYDLNLTETSASSESTTAAATATAYVNILPSGAAAAPPDIIQNVMYQPTSTSHHHHHHAQEFFDTISFGQSNNNATSTTNNGSTSTDQLSVFFSCQ
nr:uncharacterized protein LOC124491000 isoform X2 [Dermatophagoides farinae]